MVASAGEWCGWGARRVYQTPRGDMAALSHFGALERALGGGMVMVVDVVTGQQEMVSVDDVTMLSGDRVREKYEALCRYRQGNEVRKVESIKNPAIFRR